MKAQLPKRLTIGRTRFAVKLVQRLPGDICGCFVAPPDAELRIARTALDGLQRYPPRQRHATFCHELTHAILWSMGHQLWRNEKFVDAFSERLSQALLSADYEP